MNRYIDADTAKINLSALKKYNNIHGIILAADEDAISEWIDKQPTADVVEVVRCKDCRYWRDNDHTCKYSFTSPMCANEFCSRGERAES